MTGHDRDLRTLASIATHNSHATQKQAPTLLLPLIKQLSPPSYLSPVPWGVTDVLISKHFLKPAPCPMGLIFTFKSNFPSAFLISFSYINRVLGPDCILWAQGIPVPKTCSKSPKMFFCCEDPNRFWTSGKHLTSQWNLSLSISPSLTARGTERNKQDLSWMTHDKEDTKSQISPPALTLPVAKGRMTSN